MALVAEMIVRKRRGRPRVVKQHGFIGEFCQTCGGQIFFRGVLVDLDRCGFIYKGNLGWLDWGGLKCQLWGGTHVR